MFDPVIFDLDGTLLNTLGDLCSAGNYALNCLGFPVHEECEYKLFVGNGIPKLIERILPKGFSENDFNEAYRIFSEYYSVHNADRTVPYEGIAELVAELNSLGITCLCNTNKSHSYAVKLLKRFFADNITEIIGGENGFERKPAPDAARYFAEKYKKPNRKPIYIGDSSVDMQTAINAEIDACGVLWGFRTRDELESYKPAFLVNNAKELRSVILGECCQKIL